MKRKAVKPPWVLFPEVSRTSSFWYSGGGDEHNQGCLEALERLGVRERVAYFRSHGPVPAAWADWVASVIYDDWESEPGALVQKVERLYGLVDSLAWEAWLAAH